MWGFYLDGVSDCEELVEGFTGDDGDATVKCISV